MTVTTMNSEVRAIATAIGPHCREIGGMRSRGRSAREIAQHLWRNSRGVREAVTAAATPVEPVRAPVPVPDVEKAITSFHEAAHAVAVLLAGGQVQKVEVYQFNEEQERNGNRAGACWPTYPKDAHPDRALVAAAGPWAAAFATDRNWKQILRHHDEDAAVVGDFELSEANVRTLKAAWPAIRSLAEKLMVDGIAHHSDVCAALGVPLTGPDAYFKSMLASGFKVGEFSDSRR